MRRMWRWLGFFRTHVHLFRVAAEEGCLPQVGEQQCWELHLHACKHSSRHCAAGAHCIDSRLVQPARLTTATQNPSWMAGRLKCPMSANIALQAMKAILQRVLLWCTRPR